MLDITSEQRRALRASAHALNPVVSISQNGLSESVLKEIERSLESHELIKIRVYNDEREVRDQYLSAICEQLGAAPVQHIGKLLVYCGLMLLFSALLYWRGEQVAYGFRHFATRLASMRRVVCGTPWPHRVG